MAVEALRFPFLCATPLPFAVVSPSIARPRTCVSVDLPDTTSAAHTLPGSLSECFPLCHWSSWTSLHARSRDGFTTAVPPDPGLCIVAWELRIVVLAEVSQISFYLPIRCVAHIVVSFISTSSTDRSAPHRHPAWL
ncbi:hypothetical protein BV20DRAFT_82048 [Pilatotrama ljubarskyi]|nr:hypothetical protein BV20DRAFT_82048 [Pilatotrama ljubarskyi]